jgi:hypothetical protein
MADQISNTTTTSTSLPAEFAQLPLHAIIADPLMAVIDAQSKSAVATQSFIQSFLQAPTGNAAGNNNAAGANAGANPGASQASNAMTVDFSTTIVDAADPTQTKSISVSAPLLSIVPIPNIRIDSLSISFKYEVSQVISTSSEADKSFGGTLGAKAGLALWSANLSLTGNVSSSTKQSSTTNRSGVLDIEVHASEAPMPEGLSKILSILSNAVIIKDNNTGGGQKQLPGGGQQPQGGGQQPQGGGQQPQAGGQQPQGGGQQPEGGGQQPQAGE